MKKEEVIRKDLIEIGTYWEGIKIETLNRFGWNRTVCSYYQTVRGNELLKVLVAFLSNRKTGGQLGLLLHPLFLKIVWLKLRESYLAKKRINMQISL